MKKMITLIFTLIFASSFAICSMAADMPQSTKTTTKSMATSATKATTYQTQGGYPAGPIQKLERGFNNAAFGWTEIPKRIVDKTKQSNPIKGLFLGMFQGTCKAFARTVSGLSEVATFPLGRYDKPQVLPDMPAAK